MGNKIQALFLGDVFGQPGCRAVFISLKKLISEYNADFVVINGENASDGLGISSDVADQFFQLGADVITTGNHVWQQQSILQYLDTKDNLLRPHNYPPGVPGKGFCVIETRKHVKVAVINLQGRESLPSIDCPFREAKNLVRKLRQETKVILIDFHAESVEEKEALAMYLDGEVSAVVGTHTHIPTADERILKNGTAYISDIGMSGPFESVIGCKPEISIQRSLTQMPIKMEVAESSAVIHGFLVGIDCESGRAEEVRRIVHVSSL
ncbi:MAG: TIGR00282 family metallophosphoesterase [Spirochaetales bacterium]|nr:TIGR00282 family metallophosphoesterase [Spirochaetales bacterium]